MPKRLVAATIFVAAAASIGAAAAVAQTLDEREGIPGPIVPLPEEPAPAGEGLVEGGPGERAAKLDALFQQLSQSDPQTANSLMNQIFSIWSDSGSDTANYLLIRAREALEAEALDTALLHLNDLVRLEPEFAEAWNLRATVFFLLDDYGPALADIRRTLVLEPRHFGAIAGLGIILDRLGMEEEALAAFRQALELHPHLEGATDGVRELTLELEGIDI